jgi:hypothetical protein
MKQAGGVPRIAADGLDVTGSPIGQYDAMLINAVSQRWYDLLDERHYDGYKRGKVVVRFTLHSDGRVTDSKVLEENVGLDYSLLCEMAILDPAPYGPWPTEMRRMIAKNQRTITFTFYYH